MTPTNTPALTDQMQLVWVQNLIGMIEGTFHPTDRWNAIFIEQLSKLPAPPRVDPAPASEAAEVEPFCWVMPGTDNVRDGGWIDEPKAGEIVQLLEAAADALDEMADTDENL